MDFTDYDSEISDLIAKKPKYNINPEYFQNQGLAKNKAFGRNKGFQLQEQNIAQQAANDIGMAQQFSPSSSAILSTLSSISGGKMSALRGLAQDEALYQGNSINDLLGANTALAEEKDKEWNYNINEPFQLKMNELVQKRKSRDEQRMKLLDTIGSIGTFAVGGGLTI